VSETAAGWRSPFRLVRSVRMRLTLWYTGIFAAMLLLLGIGVHFLVRASLRAEISKEFSRSLGALEGVVRENPEMLPFFDSHSIIDFFLVRSVGAGTGEPSHVESSAGSPAFSTTTTLEAAPPNANLPTPESLAPAAPTVYESARWRDEALDPKGNPFRSISQWPWSSPPPRSFRFETRKVDTLSGTFEIIVAQDSAPYERSLRRLTLYLVFAAPVGLLMAAAGGFFLAGRALSPVGEMANLATQINADRLSMRLPVENPDDEFGRLARAFNATLAQLEDSFERLRRFTANVSHELRTPLTAIRTVGEVALADPDNSDLALDSVASMLEETDRLVRLVNDLMLLARGDVGAIPLKPERIDLLQFSEEVAELLRVLAEEKSQELIVSGAPHVVVEADRSMMRQVLSNIIDNAIRHTPPGGRVEVRVMGRRKSASIEVQDQGPGIASEHHDRIFDRFYRVAGEAGPEGSVRPGAGLGLSIAKWAAEANGARINLKSTHGQGSTFILAFTGTAKG